MEKTERLMDALATLAPDMARQIIYHDLVMAYVGIGLALPMLLAGIWLVWHGYRLAHRGPSYNDNNDLPCHIFGGATILAALAVLGLNLHTLWVCYTMPQLDVLHHVLGSMK
jgi:hypothetical protein